jgi:hypothetical protein
VNPNCVSTSSTTTLYAAPWRAKAPSLQAALYDLDKEILSGLPGARKVQSMETPSGWYVAYAVQGRFDKPDTVEFLFKSEGVQNRNWEGDREGAAVFFRSIAGTNRALLCTFCFGPLQERATLMMLRLGLV